LALPFHYNRTVVTTVATGTGYSYAAQSHDNIGATVAAAANYSDFFDIANANTNHFAIQPKIALSFGNFKLDEELRIPIFGVFTKTEENKGGLVPGVGSSSVAYTSASGGDTYHAVWDSRFNITNILTPKYNISSEVGKVNFSVTAALPFTLGLTTHSAQGKRVTPATTVESKGFATRTDFTMGIAPEITTGLRFKPLDFFSLQAGLRLKLFKLSGVFGSTKVKGLSGADATNAATFGWAGTDKDATTNTSGSSFAYPDATYSLGFTLNIKAVSLDFAFVQNLHPAIITGIYEGVGATLGGPDTSIVLTAKF
jgi:hypothetical protein